MIINDYGYYFFFHSDKNYFSENPYHTSGLTIMRPRTLIITSPVVLFLYKYYEDQCPIFKIAQIYRKVYREQLN